MHNLPSGNSDLFFPMVLITGAGRSGTGIAGRILGSGEHTVFAYEPQWLPAIAALMAAKEMSAQAAKFLLEVCIHDLEFYPQLIGRKVNLRPGYSSSFNYHGWDELLRRLALPDRRRDYQALAGREQLRFVFKMPDVHLVQGALLDLFPQLKIIHLVRDGRDVIASGLRRQWYTDEFYRNWVVTWFCASGKKEPACPWFVEERYRAHWAGWNPATRGAYNWVRMVRHGLDVAKAHPDRMMTVKYETFATNVRQESHRVAEWAELRLSALSRSHMDQLREYEQADYAHDFVLDGFFEKEFLETLEQCGYQCSVP